MLLFLDVDGVLNSDAWFARLGPHASGALCRLDPQAVARLNRVTDRPGVDVVVSSSWRLQHPWQDLQEMLEVVGFRGRIVGCTPSCEPEDFDLDEDAFWASERGLEIALWIERHLPAAGCDRGVAIVDDEGDMGFLRHRLVQTSAKTGGLQDAHVERLLRLLETPLGALPVSAMARLARDIRWEGTGGLP